MLHPLMEDRGGRGSSRIREDAVLVRSGRDPVFPEVAEVEEIRRMRCAGKA